MRSSQISALAARHPLSFVLSAGRTGTMFLTKLIDHSYEGVHCIHEPRPSRFLLVGGNLRNHFGPGTAVLRGVFEAALRRRLQALSPGERYVEINPLMTPSLDVIRGIDAEFNVLHMVRDPRTWAPSMRTFKASGYRRHIIDFVPFTKPLPFPRPSKWLTRSLLERSLWQWRFCNERIEALFADGKHYRRVRYEDVFSTDASVRRRAVERALGALGLDPAPGLKRLDTQDRVNPAPGGPREEVPEPPVQEICGGLLRRYGYDSR